MKTLKKYRWPLTGALLGALIFLLLYGVRVLDPTSVDWILNNPSPDPAQHYLGWELFRRSPGTSAVYRRELQRSLSLPHQRSVYRLAAAGGAAV